MPERLGFLELTGPGATPRRIAAIVVGLIAVRLLVAAFTPLTFDEAYYWAWSRHLAGGYYDHPPAVAFLIRLGTMIAGNGELGVRLVFVLLALPMSWAVYRAGAILFDSERIGATSALYLNLTLVMGVGSVVTTPDAPLMVAYAFALYCLARLAVGGGGFWWLAVGVAAGAALLSKYTGFFLGCTILLWVLCVREQRRWLATPWPYLGGLIALAMFTPVVLWNIDHGWVSFAKQFGRVKGSHLTLRFLAEFIPAQVALATPPIFILGVMGVVTVWRHRDPHWPGKMLLLAMIFPPVIYFLVHALHDRAQANWLGPVFSPFAIAAAIAAEKTDWSGRAARLVSWSRRWAVVVGIVMFGLVALQAAGNIIPLGRSDPLNRTVGRGWRDLAAQAEALRVQNGATAIVTTNYAVASWLMFYGPGTAPVVQVNERIRWVNMPQPNPADLKRVLYVIPANRKGEDFVRSRYATVTPVATLERKSRGVTIETLGAALAEGLSGDPFDSRAVAD